MPDMTDEQLREYAVILILEHARNIEFMSILDMANEHTDHEISDDDARKVADLLTKATIVVSFPDTETGDDYRPDFTGADDDVDVPALIAEVERLRELVDDYGLDDECVDPDEAELGRSIVNVHLPEPEAVAGG